MLHKEDIQRGLRKIDALAKEAGVVVDLSIYGGAALALTFDTRRVTRDVDILCDLMLVRRLPAWHGNIGKRLVRAPKVVVRDSGIHHALLELESLEVVLGHPVAGASWEGFVIEQILAAVPQAEASFYRTAHGAEADLVLHLRNGGAADIAHADHQDLVGWVGLLLLGAVTWHPAVSLRVARQPWRCTPTTGGTQFKVAGPILPAWSTPNGQIA